MPVLAVEALSRFSAEPPRPPAAWFADASAHGLGVELDLLAIRLALGELSKVPAGARMSLNASPATLCTPQLLEILASVPGNRLAVEITEHAPVEDYAALRDALALLRSRGVQLMVDDAGAGFSSFRHILDLRPDVIKLDLSLTRDIDTDPLRRALAASLLAFADEIGATIVAEGIETVDELVALQALGVHHGQGFLLARPGTGAVPGRLALPAAATVDVNSDDAPEAEPPASARRESALCRLIGASQEGALAVARAVPTPTKGRLRVGHGVNRGVRQIGREPVSVRLS